MDDEVTEVAVGGSYDISAYWKKSLIEIEMFKHENGKRPNTEVLWRNGTFRIKVENEDEAKELSTCIGEDGAMWDYEDYENIELLDTFDGCAQDFIFYGSGDNEWSDEDKEKLEEDYEEQLDNSDWMSRYEFLEDSGYESQGCNWQIQGGISVKVADATITKATIMLVYETRGRRFESGQTRVISVDRMLVYETRGRRHIRNILTSKKNI